MRTIINLELAVEFCRLNVRLSVRDTTGPDNAGSGLLIVKWSLTRENRFVARRPRIDTEAEVPLDVLLPTGIDAAGGRYYRAICSRRGIR